VGVEVALVFSEVRVVRVVVVLIERRPVERERRVLLFEFVGPILKPPVFVGERLG
jgi:hypothetical protein